MFNKRGIKNKLKKRKFGIIIKSRVSNKLLCGFLTSTTFPGLLKSEDCLERMYPDSVSFHNGLLAPASSGLVLQM